MRCLRNVSSPSRTRSRELLTVEALDSRLSPSSIYSPLVEGGLVVPPEGSAALIQDPVAPAAGAEKEAEFIYVGELPANVAPRIVNFKGIEIVGGLWRFQGDVIDEAPGGLSVSLGGEPETLQNLILTTDANGHFETVQIMNMDGTDNGLCQAETVDGGGLQSNLALYVIRVS